ncbi:Transcriptional regulator, ArsR family [Candidatus Rhodobacter oscarellae]|uniref:Transcriptional regulator, ArsR family n=1 Tax=Candidatus Rhodobacter oscarellae TaxID=1675527 RepID=A0A0J9H1X3_9RHOB|nr:metalloregulator ArsR/SmtB family transcription factor [Candidatus Rhodobacter lobularis]KMW59718.1 Transcriptional regulator, ArsR family [Candidatus Rhodobacter lobularis]
MTLPKTFAALGDPTRFAIVERLMSDGALAAGALQDVADISAPAISRHLKVLREAGLITQSVDKQRRIYAVAPQALGEINAWMVEHEAFWNASLDRLAAALKEDD